MEDDYNYLGRVRVETVSAAVVSQFESIQTKYKHGSETSLGLGEIRTCETVMLVKLDMV